MTTDFSFTLQASKEWFFCKAKESRLWNQCYWSSEGTVWAGWWWDQQRRHVCYEWWKQEKTCRNGWSRFYPGKAKVFLNTRQSNPLSSQALSAHQTPVFDDMFSCRLSMQKKQETKFSHTEWGSWVQVGMSVSPSVTWFSFSFLAGQCNSFPTLAPTP